MRLFSTLTAAALACLLATTATAGDFPLRTLRVAIATDLPPLSSADEGVGLRGVRHDMWEEWSRVTGVPVRFVLVPWAKTRDAVAAGVADVADPVVWRADLTAPAELSRTFMESPVHVFFNADLHGINDVASLRPFSVGVTETSECRRWLGEHGLTNLRVYPNREAMIRGALDHEVEVFCHGRYSALHHLAQINHLERFRHTAPLFVQRVHWGVAPGNLPLLAAIEQGFAAIPPGRLEELQQNWTGSSLPENPWLVPLLQELAGMAAAILAVIAGLAAWNWTLRRRVACAVTELREYGERFEALVDNLPGMVTRAFQAEDGRFELLYVSRASKTIGAGTGDSASRLSPDRLAELTATGRCQGRVRMVQPEGGVVWHDRWSRLVGRRDGGVEYETLILDVTSEVEARLALEQQEYERRLLERQIHESSKLEALGKLAGGIAHDFNNLLGAILGFATFVAEDVGDDHPTRKFVTRIAEACLRGRDLVDQILAFARQKKGEPTRFSLSALVAECHPLLEVAIPSSIAITVNRPDEPVDVVADKGQIGQILINLGFNARDALENETGTIAINIDVLAAGDPLLARAAALPPGSGTGAVPRQDGEGWTSVMIGRCDPDRPHAVLSVRDSGLGMDSALMGRVFDPFFTTKETGKGTGLGLSVVHGIVIAHDGAILVRSRAGEGTEVKIILPLAEGNAAEAGADAPAAIRAATPKARGRVLVVDDDGAFGEMLAVQLQRWGWTVARFTDPREALRAVTAEPRDWSLVVSDQVMPHLRGQDLITRIKAIRPDIPCLLCTGYDGGMDENLAYLLGIGQVLRKPVEARTLEAAITAALS